MKIGIVGYGKFGKLLGKRAKELGHEIEWVVTSKDDYTLQNTENIDWVLIASPNEFHYEQAKYFLQFTNVFLEKPGALSLNALAVLYAIADANKKRLYVDDVYAYESLVDDKPTKFVYSKWGGLHGNIIDRIAYHHFYLMDTESLFMSGVKIKIQTNTEFRKTFDIIIPQFYGLNKSIDVIFSFDYDFGSLSGEKYHNIIKENRTGKDAITEMLEAAFSQTKKIYQDNRKRTYQATKISDWVKKKLFKPVNIIGGGVYGCTAAIKLAVAGHPVTIVERKNDIMTCASSINQYRLHRGYHYPRSVSTIESCKKNAQPFIDYYRQSIRFDDDHFYGISSNDSLIDAQTYIQTIEKHGLEWSYTTENVVDNCELVVKVNEQLFDVEVLKDIIATRLDGCGVDFLPNTQGSIKDGYINVISSYAKTNELLKSEEKCSYQFELCEKPVIQLPPKYTNQSIVIMDGPFMCIDPLGDGWHVMGNVVHAIHKTTVGTEFDVPPQYREYLDCGIVKNPKYTHFPLFIESAKKYFPDIDQAEHIGSMYTIRTVLPNNDDTDSRPTVIRKVGEDTYTIFSGKIGNCIEAADKLVEMVRDHE